MIEWFEHDEKLISCRKCPRLVNWREEIAKTRRKSYKDQEYWGKPVPGFGDRRGKVLIVGLAPGAHGSNRTGRMFTGDRSGDFLYSALYDFGFASQPYAISQNDGLYLTGVYISAVCRCVPPANKPTLEEIRNCLPFLRFEIDQLTSLKAVVALGRIAYDQTTLIFNSLNDAFVKKSFYHGVFINGNLKHPAIIGSYHPSQQNTQTGRLTYPMFLDIWRMVKELVDQAG